MPLVDGLELNLSYLPRPQRRRLAQAIGSGTTLQALRRKLSVEELAVVEDLMRSANVVVPMVPPPPREPSLDPQKMPKATGAAIVAWLERFGPPGMLLASLTELCGARWAYRLSDNPDHALGDFLELEYVVEYHHNFAASLERESRKWQRVQAHATAAEAWRSQPPEHDRLLELWRRLREERERLLSAAEVRRRADTEVMRCSFEEHTETLALHGVGRLRLEPEGLSIRPSPNLSSLDVVEAALDVLTQEPEADPELMAYAVHLATPPYLRQLQKLLSATTPERLDPGDDKRLLGWIIVEKEHGSGVHLEAVACRKAKHGSSYVTRKLGLISTHHELLRTPLDRRLYQISRAAHGDLTAADMRLLRGHPRVFLGRRRKQVPVQLQEVRLAIGVRRTDAGATVRLEAGGEPYALRLERWEQRSMVIVGEDGQVVRFADVPQGLRQAWEVLATSGDVHLPDTDALDALRRVLPVLSRQVPIDADPSLLGMPLQAERRPLLVCAWQDGVLSLHAKVAPLPEAAPLTPGQGSAVVFVERAGSVHHVLRDLGTEAAAVHAALAPLELPESAETVPFSWTLPRPQEALAVVERIGAHRADVQLRWLTEPPAPPTRVGVANLGLRVGSGTDWFGLSGAVKAGRSSLDLATAMAAAARGETFVPVGKGAWARLEADLRSLLADLSVLADNGRVGALHSPMLDALEAAGASLEAPEAWRQRQRAVKAAKALDVPVPMGLQAELRPYQQEGFVWLARLASWAPGAVLADDMGLGKTLQAIALLLHRKASGPALVVAPTSVVDNWAAELSRFAPSLSVALYRGSGRATVLADCPDVVLTSFGLMGRDVEKLSGVEWGTVVLDEAQAIANPASQRSKAARALPAGFRLALSGTPVQNRTSELWSLMAFALPGLLGERAHFQRHFIVPIEHLGDASRRALLARLVGPFVLRRTKAAVLTELPPRTEVLVPVTLSEAERDAYDKARAAAVVRLEKAGKRRSFQVLQELLRLRQRACHPKLVDPASTVPGSKLKQVVRTLVQLRAAGHQALVFSSFTSHLALVRHALDEQGFLVRYLDGATSVGRRAEEVAAFQAGDGDVFLISLKAGGTGLNLTAASYVLHIDPWWNPAAEDQASDRAHRMGQDKPVTVYRFVSAGTVEEQIVALHARKRELAEALLSAADSTRQLDAKELMALLQAASAPDTAPVEPVVPKKPVLRLVHDAATAPAPAPVTPQQPEPPEPDLPEVESAQALAERFRAWMESEQAAGRIHTRRTVVSYCRAVDNLVTWAATLGHTSAQAVLDHADDYVALAKAGKGLSKSDKTVAKTAVRRLRALVDRP